MASSIDAEAPSAVICLDSTSPAAAIATEVPVQPVVLRYRDAASQVSQAPSYVGDTSLAASMWSTVMADKLVAAIVVENARGTRHADRRALAEHLRETIAERLEHWNA